MRLSSESPPRWEDEQSCEEGVHGLCALQGPQGSLDTLLQGRVPMTLTGYFGALSVPAPALVSTAAPGPLTMTSLPFTAPSAASEPGLLIFTALVKAFMVKDVWREWKEGFAGRPAIRELEEKWGNSWRPGNTVRVQFCRPKVIWNEILA